MAENNLVEATAIRKRQVIGEIIKNTEFCCLVWKETGQRGQYTASTRGQILLIGDKEYSFYISKINSGIYLDVLTNCRRFVTYDSFNFPDVLTLYNIIEGIAERRVENITEAIQNLQSVPPRCGILYTEYARGGIVTGGKSQRSVIRKGTEGGIEVGGHAPYNQVADSTGGASIGGEAKVNPIIELPEGGISVGGSTNADQIIYGSGGIEVGGSVLFETNLIGSGGVVSGGEIPETTVTYDFIGLGGVQIEQGTYAWYSFSDSTSGTILYSVSYNGFETQYFYNSLYNLEKFAVDSQNKRIFYIDSNNQIHRSSQLDSSNDTIIGSVTYTYANIDYDNGYLAYQNGGNLIVADDNGNVISTFAYPSGGLHAIAVDGTNEHIYLSLYIGGFLGYRLRKYDLKTFTQLGDHPISTPFAANRLAIDRKSGILFYSSGGGVEWGNIQIFRLDTNFTFETFFSFGFQGGIYDFDPDISSNKLIVWLRDSAGISGPIYRIVSMNYDGSDQTLIRSTSYPTIFQRLWIEANPTEFADVELIKAPIYGGAICSGEASVSLQFNPGLL